MRLAAHVDGRIPVAEGGTPSTVQAEKLNALLQNWRDEWAVSSALSASLEKWVDELVAHADDSEDARIDRLQAAFSIATDRDVALETLKARIPVFVLFSNYFRVRPLIHLGHLADRLDSNILDDEQYDYGNKCLLQLLSFTARDLSELGKAAEPQANQSEALKEYRDQLDRRKYQLNAASVQLTNEIRSVWKPSSTRPEADRLRLDADGQYLKVVVEDELGVEIELDQRSEGFQWLVSFFVVFFAEATEKHENAILLLDEPGMSLHALKQREFRETITKLADKNQTIYTIADPAGAHLEPCAGVQTPPDEDDCEPDGKRHRHRDQQHDEAIAAWISVGRPGRRHRQPECKAEKRHRRTEAQATGSSQVRDAIDNFGCLMRCYGISAHPRHIPHLKRYDISLRAARTETG